LNNTSGVDETGNININYRAEIDGLRAIAVLSVLLYHAEFIVLDRDWFQGGFIGVDVFFVLSGYLITRILIKHQLEHGSINFLDFYERRARRILPALFTVIIVSIPFAIRNLLPSQFVEYSNSILSAVFFGSNFFFYYQGVLYESGNALLKPFLHTWSLGIEEQFYIIFPALLFLLNKYIRQYQFPLIVAALLLSFLFAQYTVSKDDALAFYGPLSRFWELLFGSLIAFNECHRGELKHRLANQILPGVGLFFILFAVVTFDADTMHPGFATLIPVIGTVFILGSSGGEDPISKLLSSKAFVATGLLSYSLYLWHYPVFAFMRIGSETFSNVDKLAGIACVLGLSFITYFVIERPFRNRKRVSTKLLVVTLSVLLIGIVAIQSLVIKSDGVPDRFSRVEGLLNFERDNEKLRTLAGTLAIAKWKTGFDTPDKQVLILGNSHAMDVFNVFYQNKTTFKGYDFYWERFKLSCADERDINNYDSSESFYNSEKYRNSDVIVISTRYNHYLCNQSSDTDGLPYLIQRAQRDNKGVIVFGNTTEFSHINNKIIVDNKFYLAEENMTLSKILIDKGSYEKFSREINLQYFLQKDRKHTLNEQIKNIANLNGVPYFDKFEMLCSEAEEVCFGLTPNGYKSFYDYGHYTLEGAKFFGERMFDLGMYDVLQGVTPD
jgi:peptidoglycan/LPS O-acetylase OafA/YrhL